MKHRKRRLARNEKKLAHVLYEIEHKGFIACEGSCGRRVYDVVSAMGLLDWHHKTFLSHGGDDSDENRLMVCRSCHRRIHLGDGV